MEINLTKVYLDLQGSNYSSDLNSLKSAFVVCAKVLDRTNKSEELPELVSQYRLLEEQITSDIRRKIS